MLTLHYDVLADFEPIALISADAVADRRQEGSAGNNLREMIAWLKANPDKASLGTAGDGSPSHIAGMLFQNVTGTRFQLIPYRGTAPVIPDLVSGQIELSILDPITCCRSSAPASIKIFAVMAKSRTANAPDIPTVDEAGSPGLYIAPWQAIWAPKGTPKDVIAKLNGAVVAALADPAIRAEVRRAELRGRPHARSRRRSISARSTRRRSRSGGRSSRRRASRAAGDAARCSRHTLKILA